MDDTKFTWIDSLKLLFMLLAFVVFVFVSYRAMQSSVRDSREYYERVSTACDQYRDSVIGEIPVSCYTYLGIR